MRKYTHEYYTSLLTAIDYVNKNSRPQKRAEVFAKVSFWAFFNVFVVCMSKTTYRVPPIKGYSHLLWEQRHVQGTKEPWCLIHFGDWACLEERAYSVLPLKIETAGAMASNSGPVHKALQPTQVLNYVATREEWMTGIDTPAKRGKDKTKYLFCAKYFEITFLSCSEWGTWWTGPEISLSLHTYGDNINMTETLCCMIIDHKALFWPGCINSLHLKVRLSLNKSNYVRLKFEPKTITFANDFSLTSFIVLMCLGKWKIGHLSF